MALVKLSCCKLWRTYNGSHNIAANRRASTTACSCQIKRVHNEIHTTWKSCEALPSLVVIKAGKGNKLAMEAGKGHIFRLDHNEHIE